MSDLTFRSATSIAAAIRRKDVSSREVVDAHLDHIQRVNPPPNAVVRVLAESARREARTADEALARGDCAGPFHGVPMTVKDAWELAGVPSTGGTLGRAAFVPEHDATVIARMRAAGAIPIGMTNLPELSFAFESDNLVHGQSKNPYNLARTPGGSGGGGAAAIAVGMSPIEIEQCMEIFLGIANADGGKGLRTALAKAGTKRLHPLMEAGLALAAVH